MYKLLIAKMQATLDAVTQVKDAFSVPKSKITKYPSVFFKPEGLVNSFDTNAENMATYRFLMVVMVGIEGTTITNAFSVVLPKTVDAIISQFNQDWNQGTIGGHRVTVKIDSADAWEVSEEQDGLIAYAPLYAEIRLLTTN